MPILKQGAKWGFNLLLASRAWLRLRSRRQAKLVILTYHRVLPKQDPRRLFEQPGMVVAPENLERHINTLKRQGAQPIFLDDWLDRREQGAPLPALSYAVTFDDGWQDNFEYAYPVLQRTNTPATIFLVSALIGSDRAFWPEQVLHLLTQAHSADVLADLSWLSPYTGAFPFGQRAANLAEADDVVNRLKALDDETILQYLQETLEKHPQLKLPEQYRYILNPEEIQTLYQSKLIRFGAHTRHHYRLNRLRGMEQLQDEIVGCKQELTRSLPHAVTLFCYPNGDITENGEALVGAHYRGACTTKTGMNTEATSPWQLNRFNLHDGNGSSPIRFMALLGKGTA